jgi:hypothetical protein
MDAQQDLQVLRLYLLDMSKLSQRAVDYATKGYRLGSPEFCRYVRRGDHQLGELRRNIADLCQKLVPLGLAPSEAAMDESAVDNQVRFPQSALRICHALQATCTASAEIAHHTMLLLEDADWAPRSEALEKVCYLVNRLMCLCIIALFKRESQHAEAVLQNHDGVRLFERALHELRGDASRRMAIPTALELAITNSLKQIASQTNEIAEAIIFWLEDRRCAAPSMVRR